MHHLKDNWPWGSVRLHGPITCWLAHFHDQNGVSLQMTTYEHNLYFITYLLMTIYGTCRHPTKGSVAWHFPSALFTSHARTGTPARMRWHTYSSSVVLHFATICPWLVIIVINLNSPLNKREKGKNMIFVYDRKCLWLQFLKSHRSSTWSKSLWGGVLEETAWPILEMEGDLYW